MDIEAPRPWSLQATAGFMYRTLGLCLGVGLGLLESTTHRWTGQSGRVIRLHLLGPTAIIGAGPAGGGRINVGQPGMERVEGGDFGGPSQDGPGPRWGRL